MRTYDIILDGVNESRLTIDHKFLLILSDQGFSVDLSVLKGSGFAEVKGVQAGFGLRLTEQTRGKEFIFKCANAQTIKVFVGDDEAIYNRLSGTVTLNGGLITGINNTVKTVDDGSDYGATWASSTPMAGNTPATILAPGANVNGALVITSAFFSYVSGSTGYTSLIAKGSIPTSNTNGEVLAVTNSVISGGFSSGELKKPLKIPAGMGLYLISNLTQTTFMANVVYKLL